MSSHKADVLSVQEVATNDLQNQDAARLGELGYQQGQTTAPLTIDSMLCLLTFLRRI
jgi:mRNA deadenylase 3'-5' endonuclease subunit Ccr4